MNAQNNGFSRLFMKNKYNLLKTACYTGNITMSATANLSPILFLTFRSTYGFSYSLLGLLVLVNFITQLTVDLIFSLFSHKFNIEKTVRIMPILAFCGFIIYATFPYLFPNYVYVGLVIGTIIFSASSGLAEVLLSPIIAAIPAENPDREMSKLHSSYAWGCVFSITYATLFLLIFGKENWQFLAYTFAIIPLISSILFFKSDVPNMETPKKTSNAIVFLKNKGVWLCVFAIFLGGSSECAMAQWASGYLESVMNIPKAVGDILGVAMFGLMLGLGRTLYTKYGKNVEKVNFFGALGATACYLMCAISPNAIIGIAACALTGFFTSMMWPGTLITSSDRFPDGGVLIYALMAAGGDFGASVGPQIIGIVTDKVSTTAFFADFANKLAITPDVFGMKIGLLAGALFPLCSIFIFYILYKQSKKSSSM